MVMLNTAPGFNLSGLLGGSGGPKPLTVPKDQPGSDQFLFDSARNVETLENARFQQESGFLTNQFNMASQVLGRGSPTDLLFSQAADSAGARARGNMDRLRASMGARGIDPNSGAASGLLSRIMLQQQNDLTGAKRDISIDDARQRQVGAAQNFANALNLSQFRNQSPSMVGVDTATNLAELRLAREGINAQAASQKKASKNNLLSGVIQGGLGLLAGLV
jgi:hypothetical protein